MSKPNDNILTSRVIAVVQATTGEMSDHDQRSALGMACSWVRNGKTIIRQSYFQSMFKRRDDLAEALVEALRDGDKVEQVAALGKAREVLNAPFADPGMATYRLARLKAGLVGSEKKNEKLAG